MRRLRMNKKIIIIFVIMIAFFVTSFLIAKEMYSHYRGDIISILKKKIDLTDEQTEKLNPILESSKAKREEFKNNFRNKRKEFVDLFLKDGVTKDEINAKIDEFSPEAIDFAKYILGLAIDIKGILTKEQVNKLKESYTKRSCKFSR